MYRICRESHSVGVLDNFYQSIHESITFIQLHVPSKRHLSHASLVEETPDKRFARV